MRFNFRKITSVLASAVMLGSTLGVAAAASYPAPFVTGGASDVAVVAGANAPLDMAAAFDIGVDLQAQLARQTATTSGSGTSASSTGESIALSKTSQALYMFSNLTSARNVVTKDTKDQFGGVLSTILADGTAADINGVEYKYHQKIEPGDLRQIVFDKSGESIDPVAYLNLGYSSNSPVWNYTVTFDTTLNTTSANVIGYAKLTLLGKEYTVGSGSTDTVLYLYGSGNSATISEGEVKTVKVGGESHTIKLSLTSSTTAAKIEVDGESRTVSKGASYTFGGDFEVYIKDIGYTTRETSTPSVDLLLGSNSLKLQNGQAARNKIGGEYKQIDGTYVAISATTGTGINSFTLAQANKDATGDYLKVGESFTDRVFGGLKLEFVGLEPALDASTRDSISVSADGSASASVKFTSLLAGTSGEKTVAYARDPDLVADSTLVKANLVNENNKTIHIIEGANAKSGDWIVADDGDEGRIFQVSSIPSSMTCDSTDKVTIKDIVTGTSYDATVGCGNKTTTPLTISAASYYFAVGRNANSELATVNMTWGTSAAGGGQGTQTALFPRVKLKNGEWLSFLTQTAVVNGTTYQLPGDYLLTDHQSGAQLETTNNTFVDRAAYGFVNNNINYTISIVNSSAQGNLWGIDVDNDGTVECNFNSTMGPAILIQEEKTLADSNGHAICIPLTREGTTSVTPAIATNVEFTDGYNRAGSMKTLNSESTKAQAVDLYGTWAERDSTDANSVKVLYPDEQTTAQLFLAAEDSVITSSGSAGGEVEELGSVFVTDSEVSSVSSKNLVVIGGSCVNTVAAKILGSDAPLCSEAFTAETGISDGQFLVQVAESPYDAEKVAMLLAGYEAADTAQAVQYVLTEKPSTEAGTVLKKKTELVAGEYVDVEVEEEATEEVTDEEAAAEDTNETA